MPTNYNVTLKRGTTLLSFIVLFSALLFNSCTKSDSIYYPSFPSTSHYDCPEAPNYGDSLLYGQWMGPNKDHIVTPVNNSLSGKYYAWPAGLAIDRNSGAINLSQSESGARYVVGFVRNGSRDTCLSNVIIAGISYLDNIYVLSNNETLAKPYFNASADFKPICDNSYNEEAEDDDDFPINSNGNNNCEFDDDEDDDNGNGEADEPAPGQQANDNKVKVRTTSGIINLKKTLEEGAFGNAPKNGDSKDATIYYRLNDLSQKALKKITVRLVYYEKKSDIPKTTINDINRKRSNFFQNAPISVSVNPRPPLIIITRQLQ